MKISENVDDIIKFCSLRLRQKKCFFHFSSEFILRKKNNQSVKVFEQILILNTKKQKGMWSKFSILNKNTTEKETRFWFRLPVYSELSERLLEYIWYNIRKDFFVCKNFRQISHAAN